MYFMWPSPRRQVSPPVASNLGHGPSSPPLRFEPWTQPLFPSPATLLPPWHRALDTAPLPFPCDSILHMLVSEGDAGVVDLRHFALQYATGAITLAGKLEAGSDWSRDSVYSAVQASDLGHKSPLSEGSRLPHSGYGAVCSTNGWGGGIRGDSRRPLYSGHRQQPHGRRKRWQKGPVATCAVRIGTGAHFHTPPYDAHTCQLHGLQPRAPLRSICWSPSHSTLASPQLNSLLTSSNGSNKSKLALPLWRRIRLRPRQPQTKHCPWSHPRARARRRQTVEMTVEPGPASCTRPLTFSRLSCFGYHCLAVRLPVKPSPELPWRMHIPRCDFRSDL